jgi:hypothetical protein
VRLPERLLRSSLLLGTMTTPGTPVALFSFISLRTTVPSLNQGIAEYHLNMGCDDDAVRVSRRVVLEAAPLLMASLIRCTSALGPRARFAEAFVVDPEWTAYRPILRAVITAVLPFEVAGFPGIRPEDVEERLARLFPIEKESQFLGLQRTIVLFDQIDLFPMFSGPLAQEESKARDLLARGGDIKRIVREIVDADQRAFAAYARDRGVVRSARFRDLPLDARRSYLALWHDSASIVKRSFYSSLRSLVLVTTYSMDASWPAIGYAGPLVPRTVSET